MRLLGSTLALAQAAALAKAAPPLCAPSRVTICLLAVLRTGQGVIGHPRPTAAAANRCAFATLLAAAAFLRPPPALACVPVLAFAASLACLAWLCRAARPTGLATAPSPARQPLAAFARPRPLRSHPAALKHTHSHQCPSHSKRHHHHNTTTSTPQLYNFNSV